MARFVCPLNKKIASNLYEGMDICPFECGHLPPLYKSAIRISVLILYNTPTSVCLTKGMGAAQNRPKLQFCMERGSGPPPPPPGKC